MKADFDLLKINNNIKLYGIYSILNHLGQQNVQGYSQIHQNILYQTVYQLKNNKQQILQQVEEKLQDKKYIISEVITPLDIILFYKLKKNKQQDNLIEQYPKLQLWFKDLDVVVSPIQQQLQEQYKQKEVATKQKSKKTKEELAAEKAKWATSKKKEDKEKDPNAALDPEYLKQFNSQKVVRRNKDQPIFYDESSEKNVLITAALPYVNNSPHLGNIIGCVLSADVYARFCRLRGYNTIYICGSDEYGTATEIKAKQEGSTPNEICKKYWSIQKQIFEFFDIDFDRYGRSSDPQHKRITQDIFLKLQENGLTSEQTTGQQYCQKCDNFLPDRYVNGTCPICEYEQANGDQCDKCTKVLTPEELIKPYCSICKEYSQIKETTHIYLSLDKVQPKLEKWLINQIEEGQWSENAKNVSRDWLKKGLQARCITRDLKWGTPVPVQGYENKVFYVWFDAPIGYISITADFLDKENQSGTNYLDWWKNDKVKYYQFMAKDNIPFHSIIFPSSLLGANDNYIQVHHLNSCEYLNYEKDDSGVPTKFSKSKGVGVFGTDVLDLDISIDVWRYYLLINRPEKQDTNFEWADFASKNNGELKNNIGNFCNRTLKYLMKKAEKFKIPFEIQKYDQSSLDQIDIELINKVQQGFEQYITEFEKVEIKESLKIAMKISSEGNTYIQQLVSQDYDVERLKAVICLCINILRLFSAIFEPHLPSLSAKINFLIGCKERTINDDIIYKVIIDGTKEHGFQQTLLNLVPLGTKVQEPAILFKEISDDQIKTLQTRFQIQQN